MKDISAPARKTLVTGSLEIIVTEIDDRFGEWIEIQVGYGRGDSRIYNGPITTLTHVGIKLIDGVLMELDQSALFYRDIDPSWSPVVAATTELEQEYYKRHYGLDVPLIELLDYSKFIELKLLAGYMVDEDAEDVFIKSEQVTMTMR